MSKKPLNENPSRELTDRECCGIIGGVLGGLVNTTPIAALKNAIHWWAETPEAWAQLEQVEKLIRGDEGPPQDA